MWGWFSSVQCTSSAGQRVQTMQCSVYKQCSAVCTNNAVQCVQTMQCTVYKQCSAVCTNSAVQHCKVLIAQIVPFGPGQSGCWCCWQGEATHLHHSFFTQTFQGANKLRIKKKSLFSITKHYNIEILLSSFAQSTGQYFPLLPSCRSNTWNQLFQY